MKHLILVLTMLTSISVMAETRLQCYEKFHADIENLDTAVINGYDTLFSEEETMLDQYFNPIKYTGGPQVPYLHGKKIEILNRRAQLKEWISERSEISKKLSVELSRCLKNANK